MKKINWGIIGCGDVAEIKSGPAFNKVNNSALVAVMRRDALKAADYAARHQVPAWYNDADKLIHDPAVNAIYIATPPSSHKQYTIAALNAGKPVYVEKPMAMNVAEAAEMTDVAKQKNVKLSVAHYRREQPKFKKIKQLLENKAIGDVRFCQLEFLRPQLSAAAMKVESTAWRVDPAVSGGGLFHDIAPHQLDLLYHFFGEMKNVSGMALNQAASYNAADLVTGNILFNSGVVFNGLWSFAAAPGEGADTCKIVGSDGKICFSVFDDQTFSVTIHDKREVYSFEPLQHVQQPMIQKVVEYFREESANPCPSEEAIKVMNIMDAFTAG
ncbi:MAG: Gfo/Idh/MocA family oxidoreductase [Ferruginibacter sp.]|nr:Gfo/Idh/MocA family oxidoreductase [Ferruginibacter sp.]